MNSRQRRKARKALAPVVRAVEGGYFDDLLARPYGPTQTAFAERASQLLGRGWRWPRDGETHHALTRVLADRKAARP